MRIAKTMELHKDNPSRDMVHLDQLGVKVLVGEDGN